MSETILLVGHGSRNEDGNREIELFTELWRSRNPGWRIELCFIEFAEVLLSTGLDRAAASASKVIVVPLILNAAGHVKTEIPEFIEQARQHYPDVSFSYARHLGAEAPVLAILKRELAQVMSKMDMPDPKTTGVILLARGSSDRGANGEVAKMGRWLFEESEHELVDVAFTGITFPRFETVVQRQARLGMSQIAVLPYYLFTGTLLERIQRQVARLRNQYPYLAFGLGVHFNGADEIFQLLDERVREIRDMPTQY